MFHLLDTESTLTKPEFVLLGELALLSWIQQAFMFDENLFFY